jgi:hypothetical protein
VRILIANDRFGDAGGVQTYLDAVVTGLVAKASRADQNMRTSEREGKRPSCRVWIDGDRSQWAREWIRRSVEPQRLLGLARMRRKRKAQTGREGNELQRDASQTGGQSKIENGNS